MFWPWWSSDDEADIIPQTLSFFSFIRQRMTPPRQCMPMFLTWRRPFLALQTPLLQLAHRPASPSVLLRTPPPRPTRPDGRPILTTTAVRSTTTTLPQDRAVGLIPVAPQQEQVWSLWPPPYLCPPRPQHTRWDPTGSSIWMRPRGDIIIIIRLWSKPLGLPRSHRHLHHLQIRHSVMARRQTGR